MEAGHERRRWVREAVEAGAWLALLGHEAAPALVVDQSPGGLQCVGPRPWVRGALIAIELRHRARTGSIRRLLRVTHGRQISDGLHQLGGYFLDPPPAGH